MSATPTLSLTLPHGFRISSLATTRPGSPLAKRASSTTGVLPTVAVTSGKIICSIQSTYATTGLHSRSDGPGCRTPAGTDAPSVRHANALPLYQVIQVDGSRLDVGPVLVTWMGSER